MEQKPQENEHHEHERPVLSIDLAASVGNEQAVISYAWSILADEEKERLRQDVQALSTPGAVTSSEDTLAVVNTYVELVDVSNTHPKYGIERCITAAVDRLNERIDTLPDTLPVHVDGIYPEYGDPEYRPERYLGIILNEADRVEKSIEQSDEVTRESLTNYRTMLLDCIAAFHRLGYV